MNKMIDVTLYCTENEKKNIQEQADQAGMSVSSYVRGILNKPTLKPGVPIQFYQVTEFLRDIGNNLNQIAAVANASHDVNAGYYARETAHIEEIIERLEREALLPEKSRE